MRTHSFLLILIYLFLNSTALFSQEIRGKVLDEKTSDPIANSAIIVNGETFYTDPSGKFQIPLGAEKNLNISVTSKGYKPYDLEVANEGNGSIELGILFLGSSEEESSLFDDNYIIDLNELELFDTDQQVSSLLSAAWDPFSSIAGYNFGATRFNARGLSQNHSSIYLNGAPFNNLGDGRYFWSLWGGLNDAFRTRYSQHGMNTTDFTISGFAGTQDIDLRATTKRAGTRITMDHANRSYQYRTMLTHNSGVQENGWAYALTVSKRWGSGGYVEGTYYDGYAYFGSVDKRLNEKHSLNLLAFASPTVRGRGGASTQDVYDLLNNNYYNPNWGYQNGKVRNSREYRTHQPVFMFRHDFTPSDLTTITSSLAFQTGKFGSTRIGWLEASDPRPDYYGNLPYDNRESLSEEDFQKLIDRYSDPSVRQLDWERMYNINRERQYEIRHISGDPSLNRMENISAYIIEESRFDNNKLAFNSVLNHQVKSNVILKSGISLQYDRNHNFKIVDDLLGGKYYLDVDGFALRETTNAEFIQNDLSRPNRLLREGDRFGYDYYKHMQNGQIWGSLEYSLDKVDLSFSGQIAHSRFWREGLMENGKFPGSGPGLHSLGNSDVAAFTHGMAKLGATYKMNGRNYIYANVGYMTRAPFSRNGFTSPNTRNSLVDNMTTEKIHGGELGYILRHPKLNARFTGYYVRSADEIKAANLFLVNDENSISAFANLITSGIEKVSYGFELGLDYKLSQTVSLRYAGALGEYYFDSRQNVAITIDNSGVPIDYDALGLSYYKNFNIPGIPQIANTLDLRYDSPYYWSASLSASYFDDIYIDANPIRRIEAVTLAIDNYTNSTPDESRTREEILTDINNQEKFDPFFKLDLFVRKSWKFGDYRLAANVSVENILNTKTNIIGGYEQLRFDYIGLDADRWGSRYYYAFGTTYRGGITLSF